MPGTVGSGGRNRLSVEQHVFRGTFKPSRHGRQTPPAPAPRPGVSSDWQPSPADLEALRPQARLLLEATLRLYRLDACEGQQALLALRSLTHVEAMEAEVTAWTYEKVTIDGAGQEHREQKAHPLLPAIARERRLFLSAWTALRLGRP